MQQSLAFVYNDNYIVFWCDRQKTNFGYYETFLKNIRMSQGNF